MEEHRYYSPRRHDTEQEGGRERHLGSTAFEGGVPKATQHGRTAYSCSTHAMLWAMSRRECLPCRVGSDELFPGDSDHRYQVCARLPKLKLHITAHRGLVAQLYLE